MGCANWQKMVCEFKKLFHFKKKSARDAKVSKIISDSLPIDSSFFNKGIDCRLSGYAPGLGECLNQ